MHLFMNSYDALLSIHFLVKCRNINDTALEIKSLICTVFSMFNIVLANVNYFQDILYRYQAGFCFF